MGSPLDAWDNFYVIVGSSAGALTGLQFVVMALIADSQAQATKTVISAFGTPTIAHFCAVLGLAAIITAPWPSLTASSVLLVLLGIWGTAYTTLVFIRTRRVTEYKPVAEDWVFHVILPYVAYILLLTGGFSLTSLTQTALFMIGTMAVILLFVGIHNAWDTVTFIVTEKMGPKSGSE